MHDSGESGCAIGYTPNACVGLPHTSWRCRGHRRRHHAVGFLWQADGQRGDSTMTLTLPGLIVLIVIAAICGAVGKALAGGGQGGLIASIALGFIGALRTSRPDASR